MGKLAELHPRRFFLEAWREIDKRREPVGDESPYDYSPLITFLFGALFLTLMEYFGGSRQYVDITRWIAEQERDGFWTGSFFTEHVAGQWYRLAGHCYWAFWRFLGFMFFPILVLRFVQKQRVRDQYLSTDGFFEHLWIYLGAFAVVLVAVICVSYTEGFSTYYPFYRATLRNAAGCSRSWADFLIWESFYLLQFLSLEFFFRGWWLKSSERSLGSHAIFVMIVPYVMIHFGKEFAETLGAILAGVALGTLAMRTKSIWGGFLVHSLVAVSMDVAALLQTNGLPETFWPPGP